MHVCCILNDVNYPERSGKVLEIVESNKGTIYSTSKMGYKRHLAVTREIQIRNSELEHTVGQMAPQRSHAAIKSPHVFFS